MDLSPPPLESRPASDAHRTGGRIAIAILTVLSLYVVDLACAFAAPEAAGDFVRAIAVPFDLMVCVPTAFYLLVVRRFSHSPALVLPMIALGGVLSSFLAPTEGPSLLPLLTAAALALEAAIIMREGRKVARAYRAAKSASSRPNDWFAAALGALVRSERIVRLGAGELATEWYLLRSWGHAPDIPAGCRAFTQHRQSGHMALVGTIAAVMLAETAAVHLLVARWSTPAACALTALSLYACAILVGDARATVLNPLLVDDHALTVRWGARLCERIPLDAVRSVGLSEPGEDAPKAERLSLAAMGARPCWIELSRPVPVRTAFGGMREVRWLCAGPDDPAAFAHAVLEARKALVAPDEGFGRMPSDGERRKDGS
ncbi:hypothetical protein B5F40_05540 [Gordonibacter sp. An230]|uniref:hypothetical protein n=1 Tax=Gordonibacter sp. An230 TaxID=1965592 RepID=UPI000B56C963|nr:hypothetical protein [Gordonibacter sp. An230]OUO90921.1 hypothetical protein B5F40_05540 [Gordonibacter sp. An230]